MEKYRGMHVVLTLIMGMMLCLPGTSFGQAVKDGFLTLYDYGSLDGAVDEDAFRLKLGQWIADYNKIKRQVLAMPKDKAEEAVLDGAYKDKLGGTSSLSSLDDVVRPVLDRWAASWEDGKLQESKLTTGDRKVIALLNECGIKFDSIEGDNFLRADWNYLNTLLLPNPSPETLAYMTTKGGQPDYFFSDGGCFYLLEEMGAWAVEWEKFLTTYPGGKYQQLAGQQYHMFMEHLLFSRVDNTPAFPSWNQGKMEDYWVEGLQAVVANHPGTQTAKIVEDFLAAISKDGLTLSSANEQKFAQRITAVFQPAPSSQQTSPVSPAQTHPLSPGEQKLLGKHLFSLQWISWEQFGTAVVTQEASGLHIKAKQELNGDYVTLIGQVTVKNEKEFTVTGDLITCVHYINNGEPCARNGTFTFKNTGTRKYWRLQEMDNPCDIGVDYVDIYF